MSDKVNQEELYKAIRRIVDIDEDYLDKIITTLVDVVCTELKQGKEVKIPGLCHINVKHLNACVLKIRGKDVPIPARKSVNIRPTAKLINAVQNKEVQCEKQLVT